MSEVWFTSDTHFSHANIIKYCNRPFTNVGDMDAALVDNWNARVAPKDLVYHLGDFCWGTAAKWEQVRAQLNGDICLIRGNHDRQPPQRLFGWVKDYYEATVYEQKIILFHYPMRSWHHNMRGVWHLFGHCHGGVEPFGRSLDIGVDCWKFKPIHFSELKQHFAAKPIAVEEKGFCCRDCKTFPCKCEAEPLINLGTIKA